MCIIKEMALNTKFQEAAKAVESATLEIDLTKMIYKEELKKWKKNKASQKSIGDLSCRWFKNMK